jgi:hypothetical protein
MNDFPMSVPCPRNHCDGVATFEQMEQFSHDARPVYLCQCGARLAVHVDELPKYVEEFTV